MQVNTLLSSYSILFLISQINYFPEILTSLLYHVVNFLLQVCFITDKSDWMMNEKMTGSDVYIVIKKG